MQEYLNLLSTVIPPKNSMSIHQHFPKRPFHATCISSVTDSKYRSNVRSGWQDLSLSMCPLYSGSCVCLALLQLKLCLTIHSPLPCYSHKKGLSLQTLLSKLVRVMLLQCLERMKFTMWEISAAMQSTEAVASDTSQHVSSSRQLPHCDEANISAVSSCAAFCGAFTSL